MHMSVCSVPLTYGHIDCLDEGRGSIRRSRQIRYTDVYSIFRPAKIVYVDALGQLLEVYLGDT
jgi:hypothetical protein